ncbi:MAG: SPOR domain-containing protein [Mariprofundus sp.]|nr:SPOR domain-containing protein [Mariprofundus sp.]
MAKQDFAQVQSTIQPESGSGSGAMLNAIGIVIIAALCFGGGYWLGSANGQQAGKNADVDAVEAKLAIQVAKNKVLLAKTEALQDSVEQWKRKAQQDAHSKVGDLSFYKELPEQSVTPAPMPDMPVATVASKVVTKPVPVQRPEVVKAVKALPSGSHTSDIAKQSVVHDIYRIQLASFRTQSDAMRVQQQLSQAGFPALIHKVDLGSKGLWYRIYAGPYHSKPAAEADQKKIGEKIKLNGFLIRGG